GESVVDQDRDELTKAEGIADDRRWLWIEDDLDVLSGREWRDGVECFPGNVREVERQPLHLDSARVRSSEQAQVGDERREMVHLIADVVQRLTNRSNRLVPVAVEVLDARSDHRQGRSAFVAGV